MLNSRARVSDIRLSTFALLIVCICWVDLALGNSEAATSTAEEQTPAHGTTTESETTTGAPTATYGVQLPLNGWQLAVMIAVPISCCVICVVLTAVFLRQRVVEASQIVFHSEEHVNPNASFSATIKADAGEALSAFVSARRSGVASPTQRV